MRLFAHKASSKGLSRSFPYQSNHHSLDEQFVRRNDVIETGALGFQEGAIFLHDVTFQGRLLVDQGGDDLSLMWLSRCEDDDVTLPNASIHHRMAAHAERKHTCSRLYVENRLIYVKKLVGVFGGIDWDTCGNSAEDRDSLVDAGRKNTSRAA